MRDRETPAPGDLSLRLAKPDDADTLFHWRNDPWLVSLSSGRREVTREEHERWFSGALDRNQHLLFIVQANGREIGTVRIDKRADASGLLSIYLLNADTGKGYGVKAIQLACEQVFGKWTDLQCVVALVREGNRPSIEAFHRAGFASDSLGEVAEGHVRMQLQKPNRAQT